MNVKKWYVRRILLVTVVVLSLCVTTGMGLATAFAGSAATGAGTSAQIATTVRWDICMAIAVAIGLPCLGAGYAVAQVGAAALGAASEKPELLTRSLLFVALAEGIAIYGLLVAILLYIKL